MKNRLVMGMIAMVFIAGVSGCAALLIGGAAGGGTALWLAGKVVNDASVPMDKGASATRDAFKAMEISLTNEVIRTQVTQLRGKNKSGQDVNVDIFSTSNASCRFEIRVGLGDEGASRLLLTEIQKRL